MPLRVVLLASVAVVTVAPLVPLALLRVALLVPVVLVWVLLVALMLQPGAPLLALCRLIHDFKRAGPFAIARRQGKLRGDSMAAVLASVLASVLVWEPVLVSAYASALMLA